MVCKLQREGKMRDNYAMHLYQPCTFFLFLNKISFSIRLSHALCWHREIHAVTVADVPCYQTKTKQQKKKREKNGGQKISCLYSTSNSYTSATIAAGLGFILYPPISPCSLTQTKLSFKHLYFLILLGDAEVQRRTRECWTRFCLGHWFGADSRSTRDCELCPRWCKDYWGVTKSPEFPLKENKETKQWELWSSYSTEVQVGRREEGNSRFFSEVIY